MCKREGRCLQGNDKNDTMSMCCRGMLLPAQKHCQALFSTNPVYSTVASNDGLIVADRVAAQELMKIVSRRIEFH
jgi:hypothetical protein